MKKRAKRLYGTFRECKKLCVKLPIYGNKDIGD